MQRRVLNQIAESTETHREWATLRRLRNQIPIWNVWPGVAGLGAVVEMDEIIDHGAHSLAPNSAVRWLMMVTIPQGHTAEPLWANSDQIWTTLSRARLVHGMPVIGGSTPELAYDFRRLPFGAVDSESDPARTVVAGDYWHKDTLNSDRYPQLFRASNGLLESVLAHAFAARRTWESGRYEFRETLGLPEKIPTFVYGPRGTAAKHRPAIENWFPRAYLGFPAATVTDLFDRVTNQGRNDRYYPPDFQSRFAQEAVRGVPVLSQWDGYYIGKEPFAGRNEWDRKHLTVHRISERRNGEFVRFHDLVLPRKAAIGLYPGNPVRVGDEIAHIGPDLRRKPSGWRVKKCPGAVFDDLRAAFPGELWEIVLRGWFGRQALYLPGRPDVAYMPAGLVAPVARDLALPGELLWDLEPCQSLFDDESETFRFPPVLMSRWDDWYGCTPDETFINWQPHDPRFFAAGPDERGRGRVQGSPGRGPRSPKTGRKKSKGSGRRRMQPQAGLDQASTKLAAEVTPELAESQCS